ncbi:hypothetical protein P43SY_009294 [Pythium insidiosum]|uniref:Uncharacterized protein n=1 Tax=Pythium insidiosum TaxID=114742 RepID=A0AAD5LGL9_PYTIN|nr:hypothetical protein P43SY_009294 [Pythium insidiosum]
MTPGSDDARVWNQASCFGRPRCGARQAREGFGVDTGLNFHSSSGCQCARGPNNYDGIPKAVYSPGQRVCIAYPPKNHVAAPCTSAFIPDTGTVITRSPMSPSSDDAVEREYQHGNGQHVFGQVDYKGFQNCPNFCSDMEKALCTMCFDLEPDLAPGEYTFKWTWFFNSESDAYSTCWEAQVRADGAVASPSAPTAPSESPSVAPFGAFRSQNAIRGEGTVDENDESDSEDCAEALPVPSEPSVALPPTPSPPTPRTNCDVQSDEEEVDERIESPPGVVQPYPSSGEH